MKHAIIQAHHAELKMFKPGQIYKAKIELSPTQNGFGRATIVAVDAHSIYFQLKCSKGTKVARGAKISFVGSSANNRFNGLWSSEIRGAKIIEGRTCLQSPTPKFEQSNQRRVHVRTDISVPLKVEGDDWKDFDKELVTRNVSRFGLGFAAQGECVERFVLDQMILISYDIGPVHIRNRFRIVNSRFNWLLNRTEIGAEIVDVDTSTLENIENMLTYLGSQLQGTKGQMSDTGSLRTWVKAGRDNLSFVKGPPPAANKSSAQSSGNEPQEPDANENFEDLNDYEEDVELQ